MTTSIDRNPFKTRRAAPGEREIYDERTGRAVTGTAFDASPAGVAWGEERRVERWIDEASREARYAPVGEPTVAEVAAVVAADEAEDRALADQLIGELNQVEHQWDASLAEGRAALAATLRAAYDELSARIRSLGFEIGPVGGALALYDAARQAPLVMPAPVVSEEAAALDAILFQRADYAQRQLALAEADGDKDGAKIARNSLNAYTKARALILGAGVDFPGRAYLVTPVGDILVRSSSRTGQWHSVRRTPIDGDGYAPIVCACDHGAKGGFGICLHVGLYESWEELMDRDSELAARVTLRAA